jgi:hypothetical protein
LFQPISFATGFSKRLVTPHVTGESDLEDLRCEHCFLSHDSETLLSLHGALKNGLHSRKREESI